MYFGTFPYFSVTCLLALWHVNAVHYDHIVGIIKSMMLLINVCCLFKPLCVCLFLNYNLEVLFGDWLKVHYIYHDAFQHRQVNLFGHRFVCQARIFQKTLKILVKLTPKESPFQHVHEWNLRSRQNCSHHINVLRAYRIETDMIFFSYEHQNSLPKKSIICFYRLPGVLTFW